MCRWREPDEKKTFTMAFSTPQSRLITEMTETEEAMPRRSQRIEVGEGRLAYRFGSEAFTAGDAGAQTAPARRVISRSIDHYSLSEDAHRGRRLPDRVFLHPRLPAVDFYEDGSHPAITVRASRDLSSPNVGPLHAHDEFPTAHPGGRRDSHSSNSQRRGARLPRTASSCSSWSSSTRNNSRRKSNTVLTASRTRTAKHAPWSWFAR